MYILYGDTDPNIFKSQLCPGAGRGFYIYIKLWTIVIVAVASKCPASNGDWVIGGSLSSTHVVVTSRETAQYKFARAHTRDFWLYRSDTVYIDYRGPTIAQ